ncbi:type II toxin-antitoxin system CcdA family antitoxin [Hyphobacterium sp.]|uniref:type II toxin-antitoxin system CcdA family antitoxin n=1 Tax=Hyphobacterium sp. TaxID=2004662 RepID=UPI003BAA8B4B
MPSAISLSSAQRRRVNLTIDSDVMAEARALSLNTSQAAEAGIRDAIRQAREQQWRDENRQAIKAHNSRVEEEGVLLPPDWAED